jgi:hypothetical protein
MFLLKVVPFWINGCLLRETWKFARREVNYGVMSE